MTPLNPSEVDSYRDRGYLLLRQAIKPPDLASVRALILLLGGQACGPTLPGGQDILPI